MTLLDSVGKTVAIKLTFLPGPQITKVVGVEDDGLWIEDEALLKSLDRQSAAMGFASITDDPRQKFSRLFVPFYHIEWMLT